MKDLQAYLAGMMVALQTVFGMDRKAFTRLVIGGLMSIMIGAILLIIAYIVIAAVIGAAPGTGALGAGTALNTSFASTINNITMALGISGISLVVVGIGVIMYVLMGLGGIGGGSRM
jgi:hypothetical protein